MSQEIEQGLREHVWLSAEMHALTAPRLMANDLLIHWLWRFCAMQKTDLRAPELKEVAGAFELVMIR